MIKNTILGLATSLVVVLFGGSVTPITSANAEWYDCKGGKCESNWPGTAIYSISGTYNDGPVSYYMEFGEIPEIACTTHYIGDPAFGQPKDCSVRWDKNKVPTNYKFCAKEGETCKVDVRSGSEYIKVRYGNNDGSSDRWIYRYVSNDFKCNYVSMGGGYDPIPGRTKHCEVEDVNPTKTTWHDCASQGEACNVPNGAENLFLVRMGNRNQDNSIITIASGDSVKCDVVSLGGRNAEGKWADPAYKETKYCQYSQLPTADFSAHIKWTMVQSCQNGCTEEYKISSGYSKEHSTYSSTDWKNSLSMSIEASQFFVAKERIEDTLTIDHFSSVTDSLTQTENETHSFKCGPNKSSIWQIRSFVKSQCPNVSGNYKASCHAVGDTKHFACSDDMNPPKVEVLKAITSN